MATSEAKASFLTWGRQTTQKQPESEKEKPQEILRASSGLDHQTIHRPISLKRYPKDCPSLKTRWFYAVDVPKRKPFAQETAAEEGAKPAPTPKKFVPFSLKDSYTIESAFQTLAEQEDSEAQQGTGRNAADSRKSWKVPVNEDYLFDVDIKNYEIEPAYWLGPAYEVRRGTWFYPENPPRPCDENLANQLEEGYLKVRPWENPIVKSPRSASQPRSRPSSLITDKSGTEKIVSTPTTPRQAPIDTSSSKTETNTDNKYRLFGTYMNSTATYHDATTVYVKSDDLLSRMSTTVYQSFGSVGGTKLVRGYMEAGRAEVKATTSVAKRRSAPPGSLSSTPERSESPGREQTETEDTPRRSTLERQLSSLAGAPVGSSEDLAEEARKQEEKEMEDYREQDGDEQAREYDHLVLVTHGIGQRLGLRLDSINFIHDVNTMRKSLKAVYANSPDLQALNSQINELPKNCRIQVLPVCWRHLLDFPKQSLRDNRNELDLADVDAIDEDEYPSLADITVDGVPAVRNLITDLAMDVLLYQSAYREHIAGIVQRECNRIYKLFKERNPTFAGRVSLVGHSLGSAILFDILCRQKDTAPGKAVNLHKAPSSKTKSRIRADTYERFHLDLDFECENFFCLGSPIALFQMLKGRTIVGRHKGLDQPLESPFDPDHMDDPFLGAASSDLGMGTTEAKPKILLPITVSSPKCQDLYNIFHPTDPISYRIEPLISPAMSSLKPQPLPYTKKGLFGAPGIANIGARVGQSVGSMWYNFTSGVASSLLNRSLGLTGEEQALSQDGKTPAQLRAQMTNTNVSASTTKGNNPGAAPTLVADERKQQMLADQASSNNPSTADHLPTLIDSEIETLYSGFQKRRRSQQQLDDQTSTNPTDDNSNPLANTTNPPASALYSDTSSNQAAEESFRDRSRKLKREEAKVRALNSNGRVDYSIQEGVFDISLLASIASHLSYWNDEDVNHFMMSQMLSKKKENGNRNRNGDGDGDGDLGGGL
ncbi:putative ddhd domain-containing protein [Phaeomoniella chlamydospora]|uniref:Putative ddhd domain-containing protein n=1 Tax=Phaeomoniella chlamydospora TaxID=158046 RepID=A0A0G2GM97_PHACM|nr:putative ddhd domain-containing protein [Phaeomoniella chlamydospora]